MVVVVGGGGTTNICPAPGLSPTAMQTGILTQSGVGMEMRVRLPHIRYNKPKYTLRSIGCQGGLIGEVLAGN